jgi:16S rRNA (cytosine967-C5)-methyltransferase
LRRIGREPELLAEGLDIAQLETPEWLWQRWCEHYGEDTARSIAKAHGREPTLDLTPKAGIDASALAEQMEAQLLPTGSLRRATGGSVAELPGYEDGTWWVQDAAAALPARLFGRELKSQKIADLCAAPGGKTAQLAAAGAEVIALDRSAKRLERLSDNMTRLKLSGIAVKAADARNWQPEQLLDGVLLDAPCTATGTIRRQPDVAQLKTPDDLDALSEQQAELLAAAIDMVRPGGLIVYCTCSLEPEEGEAQIERLLTLGAPVRTVPIRPDELGVPESMLTPEGWLRILPGMELAPEAGDLDGFFAARLERLPDEAD